jgi:hypothetical protein
MTQNETTANLYDYRTGDLIGPANAEQIAAAAAVPQTEGVFLIDEDGDPVAYGTWGSSRPGNRSVYVAP